jgi:hypothetical protein
MATTSPSRQRDADGGFGPRLSSRHAELLRASAISREHAEARGYFTATKRAELLDLGFERYQAIVPALVLPVWSVDGRIVNYQARPDRPRIDRDRGREVRYETVAGSQLRLDVPPLAREQIGRPLVSLWLTEGVRKGDALVSAGACAIALLGVQCFRTDDWERIALEDRKVYVVYDSDVMVKPAVHRALESLAAFLTAKGALLHFVYLPQDDGKLGVDDYLAKGHTLENLHRLVRPELPPRPVEQAPHRPFAYPTAHLLTLVEKIFRRFVRFPSGHEPVVLALYVLHTWALAAARATPYLLIVSPEKQSGKTLLLEVAEPMVCGAVRATNITAAGVFQTIEAWTPTLLVDEFDSIFRTRLRSEQSEALRAVLNSGNRRGAYVVRGSQDGTPLKFATFCPKMMAGINTSRVPDTIRDRSIVLAIERKRADEQVEDYFPTDREEEFETLRSRLSGWAEENVEELTRWRREDRIRELSDRLQEAWDPLLGIAALAGGRWPKRARQAAVALAKGTVDPGDADHGHLLLVELRRLITASDLPMASQMICERLNSDEELPFGGYNAGQGMTPRDLARLLRPYRIKPRTVRTGGDTPKGYHRNQFTEAWERYALDGDAAAQEPAEQAPQAPQPPQPALDGDWDVADVADVADNGQHPARVQIDSDISL